MKKIMLALVTALVGGMAFGAFTGTISEAGSKSRTISVSMGVYSDSYDTWTVIVPEGKKATVTVTQTTLDSHHTATAKGAVTFGGDPEVTLSSSTPQAKAVFTETKKVYVNVSATGSKGLVISGGKFTEEWYTDWYAKLSYTIAVSYADVGKPNLVFAKNNDALTWPAAVFLGATTSTTAKASSFKVGESVYLYANFLNDGKTGTSKGFSHTHEVIDSSGKIVKTQTVNEEALASGSGRWYNGKTVPWLQNLPAGSYTYRFTLDSDNVIDEMDETDNVATYAFNVEDVEVVSEDRIATIVLDKGYTWFSVNVTPADASFASVFKGVSFEDDDVIKSSDGSATYYSGKWWPSPETFKLVAGRAYVVKKSTAGSVSVKVAGTAEPTSLAVKAGWNWIGPTTTEAVPRASLRHSAGFSDDDVINSTSGSMTYYGGKWYGDLKALESGVGYKAKFAKAGTVEFE